MTNGIRFARLEFSPAKCADLANRIDELLKALSAWPVRLERATGLADARAHLLKVAEGNSYGESREQLEVTARQLRRAFDWAMILNCLTDEPAQHVAEELAEAISSGTNNRKAEDILSQFWFGALLARAGLRPAVPPASAGRRPDFVISADSLQFGVEIKRPESWNSTMKAVHTAARQLRDYGRPGFIVLDLSRALRADRYVTALYDHSVLPQPLVARSFNARADQIAARVRGQNAQGHFGRIVGLFSYIRTDIWHHSRPDSPIPSVYVNAPVFELACFGLITQSAERVRELIRSAVGEMSGTTPIALP